MVLSERKLALIETILAINELSLLEEIRQLIEHHAKNDSFPQVQEPTTVYASAEEVKAIEEGIFSIENEPVIPHQEVQQLIQSWR
jgi:hypothetical protein